MDIIEMLNKAKKQEDAAKKIINVYEKFIQYEMDKYHIQDKNTCYEEVKANILKAIFLFVI